MLFLFDIDGTLIRSFMREGVACTAKGCTNGKVSKYDLGWKTLAHDESFAAKTQRCLTCMGTGVLSPEQIYDEIEVLPGALEKLDELRAAGDDIALVTNQGGIAFGYQTSEQINRKIYGVLAALGFPPDRIADRKKGNVYVAASRPNEFRAAKPPCAYVALHHPQAKDPKWSTATDDDWRKPGGGMLRQAMFDYGVGPDETMFVGDMDTDRQAAEAAGVEFRWADDFMAGVMS